MTENFSTAPFHLDSVALDWLEDCFAALTPRQKLGQLFNVLLLNDDQNVLDEITALAPGSIARLNMRSAAFEQALIAKFNAANPVPLLITADMEGSFSAPPGTTPAPNPLGFAAANDVDATSEMTRIMADQASEFGINWSFTPAIDINKAFRSAIVGTRSFGSDLEKVRAHAFAHMDALQESGFAASVKHWPGEGYDDRDQHLVTTINPLSMADWERTYGALYRGAIERGVLTVMSAHIGFPAFMRDVIGETGVDVYRPATINKYLNENLLRDRLGFKGLIVSDATPMAGLGSWLPRERFVPGVLAAGCDVILFTPNLGEDIAYLETALKAGALNWARVDQAVRRQLALKAALKLHLASPPARQKRDRSADNAFGADLLRKIPTLVKDIAPNLPLSLERHKRILVISKGVILPFSPQPIPLSLPQILRERGFEVTEHEYGTPVKTNGYDLLIYAFAEETLLTRGNINLNWAEINGDFESAMYRPWHDAPVVMISFGWPYYLFDAPMVPTYINAYSSRPEMQEIVVDAMMGIVSFKGTSPVDPFCGHPEFAEPPKK